MGLFDDIVSGLGLPSAPDLDADGISVGVPDSGTIGKLVQPNKEFWNQLATYSFEVRDTDPDSGEITGDQVDLPNFKDSFVILQLPPQSLNMNTQFAINVSATNGGIIEEHNGTVFRMITISGTTGVWPTRPQASSKPNGLVGFVSALFPEATGALVGLVKSAVGVASAAGGLFNQAKSYFGPPPGAADHTSLDTSRVGIGEKNLSDTGYYQFWQLYNFFVDYSEFKKTKKGSSARLLFNVTKDNVAYVITPLSFDLRRDARNPLSYNYSISMKAWALKDGDELAGNFFEGVDIRNPSLIKGILEVIRRGRKTIQGAENVLKGIQSDIGDIVQIASQSYMAVKDVKGLGADMLDLFPIISANAAAVFTYNQARMNEVNDQYGDKLNPISNIGSGSANVPGTSNTPSPSVGANLALTDAVSGAADAKAAGATGGSPSSTSGLISTSDAASNKVSGGNAVSNLTSTPSPSGESVSKEGTTSSANAIQFMNAILNNADAAQSVQVSELSLPPSIQAQITDYITKATQLSAGQVRELTSKLQQLSDNIAAQTGHLDPLYASTFNLPLPSGVATGTSAAKTITEDDILMMVDIQEMKGAIIGLIAGGETFKELNPDLFAEANNNLDVTSQINTPASAFPIFVNRGASLEQIATQYLGNPDKARDIAILNNLRAPYIDEAGFTIPIRAATAREFVVSDITKLIIGQSINLIGTGLASSRRVIVNIEDIGGNSWRVTTSGAADLDKYTPSTNPFLQARLPGTIGVGDTLLMPSSDSPDTNTAPKNSPLLSSLSFAEKVFKIDMALTQDGTDLVVDASGDVARSSGYANSVQAIRLAVEVEKGEIERHPTYGLPHIVGQKSPAVTPEKIKQSIAARIKADPRFTNATVVVIPQGNMVRVQITAQGRNGTGRIPVEFQIPL